MKKLSIALLFVLAFTTAVAVVPAFAGGECSCDGPGVGTPGYWKNHPEAWPVETITIGGITYTKAEAIEWMNQPVAGDKSITLFKAYVAAKLNILIGNCDWCIKEWVKEAEWWLTLFPVGSGVRANSEAWQHSHGETIYWYLDAYNNGYLCAAPRD